MSENVRQFTDASFEEDVLNSREPVIIDFWAIWCGPCLMVSPIIEQLAIDYAGKIKVGKMDVDHNPQTATKYGIRSIREDRMNSQHRRCCIMFYCAVTYSYRSA
ncbi:thiol reductase thioredoxin [candidate division KSB1 bacterium]|nr:thiol reductase thioredoxin [candidate division KSB1 bacterium]RQW02244.1 MAG: thiol reductase thioredoxin [candidate division KSB1 bacterium]